VARINGLPAPAGTVIDAWCSGVRAGRVTITSQDGSYSMQICYADGKQVVFGLYAPDGSVCWSRTSWQRACDGTLARLDLGCDTATPTPTASATAAPSATPTTAPAATATPLPTLTPTPTMEPGMGGGEVTIHLPFVYRPVCTCWPNPQP
jgi:hypothetical protein